MTDARDRWRRVEALCQAALERPAAERDAFLRSACSDDGLRGEVEMLLARESAAGRFLETGLGGAAARVLSAANAAVAGRRIGAFEIGPLLGAGAMGEVFRARDVNLDRDVALKVLPKAFAVDPDRLARFKREAQVLAALNHPNIASIYGFEESSGMQALVLELVEGPTLADRIDHGPLPIDEALPIAGQIAAGLEAAHEQGIIHRDLKPANIKLRPDGTVKVLDFGLAKVLEQEAADTIASPTITTRSMVQRGVMLGTAAYMSPEQARGLPADKRSDVWAFGVVLYEMLAGQLPFNGNDVAETLASVIGQEIDWSALPIATPPSVRRLIARCCDRDINHRLRDIGQARLVLEDSASSLVATRFDLPADRVPSLPSARPASAWRRRAIPLMLSALVTAAAAATAWYLKPSPPLQVARLSFNLQEGQSLSSGDRSVLALSPDGAQVAYVTGSGLYLRSMSSGELKPVRGAEASAVGEPVFSPDGQFIVFAALSGRTLKRVPIAGGAPVTVCQTDFAYGLSWGPDGILFVEPGKGIMRVDPEGGTPDMLVAIKDGEAVQRPQTLPGGQQLLFTLAIGNGPDRWDRARVVVQSLTSGERKTLFEGGADARYLPTGHLVYAVGGSLFAVAFDVQRLEVRGPRVPMVEGVRRSGTNVSLGTAQFSVSSNGSLVYVPGAVSAQWDLGLTDRRGEVTPFNLLPGSYEAPRVSPDGKRVVFGSDDGKEAIVWTYLLSGVSPMTRLTYGGNNRFPTWSSDGKHVVFQSDREGDRALFWQPADGGEATRLTKANAGEAHEPESWSPKSDSLLFSVMKDSDVSLWILSLADKRSTPFGDVHSRLRTGAVFSPDGRSVAYSMTGASGTTIYVRPFPPTTEHHQLHAKGGEPKHPVWSADGGQLFYNPGPGQFESVPVTTRPTFAFGKPVALPRPFPGAPPQARRSYDITPDGKFVSPIPAGQSRSGTAAAPQIQVVLNWFTELKQRVPTR